MDVVVEGLVSHRHWIRCFKLKILTIAMYILLTNNESYELRMSVSMYAHAYALCNNES